MKIVLVLSVGMLIGFAISMFIFRKKVVGVLRCAKDVYDPTAKPYLFLELKKDFQEIYSKKYIVLRVNDEVIANDSQK